MGRPISQQSLNTNVGARGAAARPFWNVQYIARKVPEVTIFFWIIKLLTTGMGETTSDYLVHQIDPIIAVAIGGVCFMAALAIQLYVSRYVPWIYWLTVVMVAIFGTMVADAIHITLGVPYAVSTVGFAVVLTAIFITWDATENTLSIHRINTRRRELFYWATVIATFALGTAAGDLTATTLKLGYFTSGIVFAVLFALPGIGYGLFGLNEIAAFWFAYVLTRPLGASFADWFGKSQSLGGLGWGDGPISLILAILIVALVAYLTVSHRDVKDKMTSALG